MSLSIIPSRQDEALRVLRRIVSFTMFLSSLLIAMILVTSYFIEGVRFELAGQVTVQIATEQSLGSVPTSTKKKCLPIGLSGGGCAADLYSESGTGQGIDAAVATRRRGFFWMNCHCL